MSKARKALPWVAGAMLALSFTASADTLQLKNGDVVRGKYLGGGERAVQFEVNGETKLYSVDQILSVTFTRDAENKDSENFHYKPADVNPKTDDSANRPPRPTPADDHSYRPDDHPAAAATPRPNSDIGGTVPAGTHLLIRMIDGVDSQTNHVGDKFRASLESDLVVDGVVVAPRGTDIYGRLSNAQEAGHLTGKAQLKLELTDISLRGQMQPIMTGEYELAGKGRGENTAEKTAGGAALGAIIGAIAGGGKGAAVGAAVGGGAGATVNIVTSGEQVRVPSETVLDFRLEQPFTPHE